MPKLNFNTESNLEQIKSIKNSRIKSDYNQNVLHKRTKQARRQVVRLRKIASSKDGLIADNCNALADIIELSLKG